MSRLSFFTFAKEKLTSNFNPNQKYHFWGVDNKTPFVIEEFVGLIPEHSQTIDFSTDLIVQNGIDRDMLSFWDVKRLVFDYRTFGGYAVLIDKLRNGEKKYSYINIANCRISFDKTKVLFAENWDKYKADVTVYKLSDGTETGIFIFKNIKSKGTYPTPDYFSANLSLDTMCEIMRYHNNNAKNGFSPSVIINYNDGTLEPDEQEADKRGIKDNMIGGSGQKIMLNFNKDKDSAITVEKLESDNLDQRFETLQKFIQNQIIIAHGLTSGTLIGIRPESQGFSKTEYEESLSIYREVKISQYIKELEYSFKELFKTDVKFIENNTNKEVVTNE
jgi:hypothetical protein